MSLLCLHGFTGSPHSFAAVADEAVCPTLTGHGADSDATTFEQEVDRLAAQISQPVHVVGYSQGARLGLGLLVNHPEKVTSATLIGLHPGISDDGERQARLAADQIWIDLLQSEGLEAFIARWEALPLWRTQARLPHDVLCSQRAVRRSHTAQGLARALRVLGLGAMPDYTSVLAAITAPLELVVGELDAKFLGLAQSVRMLLPTTRLTIVPSCGHNPLLERPMMVRRILHNMP